MPITLTLTDDEAAELVRCIAAYTDDLATLGASDDEREALSNLEAVKTRIEAPVLHGTWAPLARQLLVEASAQFGVGEHEFMREGGWRDRARMLLGAATDDAHISGDLLPRNGSLFIRILGLMHKVEHIAGSMAEANTAMRLDETLALIDCAGPLCLLARKDDMGVATVAESREDRALLAESDEYLREIRAENLDGSEPELGALLDKNSRRFSAWTNKG